MSRPSPAWLRSALGLALQTAPGTLWTLEPVRDYAGQRLALESIRGQFAAWAAASTGAIASAVGRWATTGRWPRVRARDAFFLRAAIQEAADRSASARGQGSNREAPVSLSWSAETAAFLHAEIVEAWIRHLPQWLDEEARQAWEDQERYESEWED